LRNTPGILWRRLRGGGTVAITSEGRPQALVIGLEGQDLPETLRLLDRLRAQQALTRLREGAAASGASRLGEVDVEREIAAARGARRR
jgi:antitoxin (DNA-binding transcriptional repressor) of toxin-antitoxin stability system